MSVDLIILGAGGSSREIAEMISATEGLAREYRIVGFLDDDPSKAGKVLDGVPIVGPLDEASRHPEAWFVVGVASHRDAGSRESIVQRVGLSPDRFVTLTHPTAFVSRNAAVGKGTIIMNNAVITTGVKIGSHVLISQGAQIAHDSEVGSCSILAPRATINGNVRIGESVYIGAAAVIAPNVVIGPGALVGIGAVVVSNVDAGSTVFGNPARTINTGTFRRWQT
jgi:sugar O-acyltransferase (sialic acid O-acetyltransferase NeuD family)